MEGKAAIASWALWRGLPVATHPSFEGIQAAGHLQGEGATTSGSRASIWISRPGGTESCVRWGSSQHRGGLEGMGRGSRHLCEAVTGQGQQGEEGQDSKCNGDAYGHL